MTHKPPNADPALLVLEHTSAKVRGFLYEVAQGVTNYRSLHSLTAQVEHQYHGRFLIELIQNAHDALVVAPKGHRSLGRIALSLCLDEGPFGTLYAANDGNPFTDSNFRTISQLGQSDKNPQESIGNKGIGFRSVLEICESPEIYSRKGADSKRFDGFRFAFSPSIIQRMTPPILRLAKGEKNIKSPFGDVPLVDWDDSLISKFQLTVQRHAATSTASWLERELHYLSPYLLPYPIEPDGTRSPLSNFEREDFATVIRLPLKDEASRSSVLGQLEVLDPLTVLFLAKTKSLILDSGNARRILSRNAVRRDKSKASSHEVTINDSSGKEPRKYLIWDTVVQASRDEPLRTALQKLPGKWPDLREAGISLAVRADPTPEQGVYSIFLPTTQKTGAYVHVNAPFFGEMSRKDINFSEAYNSRLNVLAGTFALDIALRELAGKGVPEARACLDLLAPNASDANAAQRWLSQLAEVADSKKIDLKSAKLLLSDSGWSSVEYVSLLPPLEKPSVLTPEVLRRHATFRVHVAPLDTRNHLFEAIAKAYDVSPYPLASDLAETVAAVAKVLHRQERPDWNGFWSDVQHLIGTDSSVLQGKKLLLGMDNHLHSAGQGCAVFFVPRRGSGDGDEFIEDDAITDVPRELTSSVAFLSSKIRVYDEKDPRIQTPLRKYLDAHLVNRFRVEDIFKSVLIPRTPSLPVQFSGSQSGLCRAILLWGLDLVSRLIAQGKGEVSVKLLQQLPVPCVGGWYPLIESMFGPDWPDSVGADTAHFLDSVDTKEAKDLRKRLLLPPAEGVWGRKGHVYREILAKAGVFDGLRLMEIKSDAWATKLYASRYSSQFPDLSQPAFSPVIWQRYKDYVRTRVRGTFESTMEYRMPAIPFVPGLDKCEELDETVRLSLATVLMRSMPLWTPGWTQLEAKKTMGYASSIPFESPLTFNLRTLPWIGTSGDKGIEWTAPSRRWHVPSSVLAGRTGHFAHLNPLPATLARQIDASPKLAAIMEHLGMPRFDLETQSESHRLLTDLAAAVHRDDVPNWDVMLGQVRSAWAVFYPTLPSSLPTTVLVGSSKRLIALEPTPERPLYLPDAQRSVVSALEQFELPMIAIEPSDAKRLSDAFGAVFGDGIVLASQLRVVPFVGSSRWKSGGTHKLRDSALEWAAPVVLTLAAFSGTRAGTGSKRFGALLDLLRDVDVASVPSLNAALLHGDKEIVSPSVPALWLPEQKVLLFTEACYAKPSLLAETLVSVIDRDDLEIQARFLFDAFESLEPDEETIIAGLKRIKISENHYREVKEHWRGDLGQLVRLIAPLLYLLHPNAPIDRLMTLDTDDAVIDLVDGVSDARLDGRALLELARSAPNHLDFGHAAHARFGEAISLGAWNRALQVQGEKAVSNGEAARQFESHLRDLKPLLRAFVAHLVRRSGGSLRFVTLSTQLDATTMPDGFGQLYWDVPIAAALHSMAEVFKRWGATQIELSTFLESASKDEFDGRLRQLGVPIAPDPATVHQENSDRLARAVARLTEIGLAWAVTNGNTAASAWQSRREAFLEALGESLLTDGYLHKWSDSDVLALLKQLPRDADSGPFWEALTEIRTIDELAARLGLSDGDLSSANSKLVELTREQERQRLLVTVCGKPFENTDANLRSLWNHMCTTVPSEVVATRVPLNLENLADLQELSGTAPKKPRAKKVRPQPTPRPLRLSKSMEQLIGLAGEIHAYRFLQQSYGPGCISPSCWVSSNSCAVFADNRVDDGAGCDFIVVLGGKTFYVEVKSTLADDDSLRLGSSEIRLARDISRPSRQRRRDVFRILRVQNALSDLPSFQFLPNPYDPRYQSMYVIEEADARLRYRIGSE